MSPKPTAPSPAVGAYYAKTHLADLLDRVARGESIVITRNRRPIAQIVPYETPAERGADAARRILRHRDNDPA